MPVLGLDLGNCHFRAVELSLSKGKVVLDKFGSYQNPKLNIESQSDEDLNKYADALKTFIAESGFGTTSVVTAIPESEVFTRVIKLPQMSEKDLRSSIAFEAEQYIPLPIKEVSFDFQVIDSDILDKDKMNVLLVAAKKTVLTKYVGLLKKAKLVPKGLEPETLAVSRVLGDTPERPSASVISAIGSENTEIIVVYKGAVRFTRTISIGGSALTRAISQSLNFEFSQAEEYKKTYGMETTQADGKVYNALKPVIDNILNEIRRSRTFYTTHNPNVIINRLIISGGTALMPGLVFYIANNLDLEVELANPWRNIVISQKLESQKELLMQQGSAFVTSVGLAMKELK